MLVVFTQRYNPVGILGGMGPEATSDLYMNIIRKLQKKGAIYDSDFPPVFIYSLPLPDVIENSSYKKTTAELLVCAAKKLESAGASFIAIACNSVFSYFSQIQKGISIPIIDIMEETAIEANKRGYKKVGLLSTKLTIKQKLFDNALKKYSIKTITPSRREQEIITEIIMNILIQEFSQSMTEG